MNALFLMSLLSLAFFVLYAHPAWFHIFRQSFNRINRRARLNVPYLSAMLFRLIPYRLKLTTYHFPQGDRT